MRASAVLPLIVVVLLVSACAPVVVGPTQTPTTAVTGEPPSPTPVADTPTPEIETPTPEQPSPTPGAGPQGATQFIAYVRSGQLLVTDITNGVAGGTSQYTMPGQNDQVYDLTWSPSGEFLAYTAPVQGEGHIFYIFTQGQSSPTDLGPGSSPSWSPDSQSLVYIRGPYPDDNIWMTTIDNPSPHPLSAETNHAWGRPVFTPDGSALIVTTADRLNMGAQGNTSFKLEQLALDGSGNRAPLPGASPVEGARLPYDLRFSPDASHLAFSTSYHLSACASPGFYYSSQPDGSNMQQFQSPSLIDVLSAKPERYFVGLDYDWIATSDALIANGIVTDCDLNSPSMGQVIGGPQMSVLRLDRTEGLIIPGMFHSLSADRTGTLVAAAHYQSLEDQNPNVELYSLQTGQMVLSLGPGSGPQLQP